MIFESLFGACPICDGNYKEHKAALLNIIPNDGSGFQIEFLELIKNHAWERVLTRYGRENPEYYPLDIWALRCVNSKIAIVVMFYEEAFIPDRNVFSYEVLTIEESRILESKINSERWIFIDGRLMEAKRKFKKNIENIRKTFFK